MKAIYKPKGKAAEYSTWACNFYVGCSNGCTYCYLKKGRGKATLGGDFPTLKKCFKDESHALEIFKKEVAANLDELRKHGLFFSFTTDPMIEDTYRLTLHAIGVCMSYFIPVKVLTKSTPFLNNIYEKAILYDWNEQKIAIGFTITWHDELEPNASNNIFRVQAMANYHKAGFKTFASIEPIIDFTAAEHSIESVAGNCDLILVGLESGRKYNASEARDFILWLDDFAQLHKLKVHMKHSLQTLTGYTNSELGFVEHDYNLFTNSQNSDS